MALAYESNTSLAFDTGALRQNGVRYGKISTDLRELSDRLDNCLQELSQSGWTTPAGTAFYELTKTNWKENIEKYAAMLDTLKTILDQAAEDYDRLSSDFIERTHL